jgi:hypothetical protein
LSHFRRSSRRFLNEYPVFVDIEWQPIWIFYVRGYDSSFNRLQNRQKLGEQGTHARFSGCHIPRQRDAFFGDPVHELIDHCESAAWIALDNRNTSTLFT